MGTGGGAGGRIGRAGRTTAGDGATSVARRRVFELRPCATPVLLTFEGFPTHTASGLRQGTGTRFLQNALDVRLDVLRTHARLGGVVLEEELIGGFILGRG